MGGGHWDTKLYNSARAVRASSGTSDFHYSDTTLSSSRDQWKPHKDLDPSTIKDSVMKTRESRDSDDHPESRAVVVCFDVTGSMRSVPETFQKSLPKLMSLLMLKGKLEHPQILVGAIGDATCDAIPLQFSQFESDNRIDEHIRKVVLEGGGGGQKHESYGLALYAVANLTDIDCYNKRGQKGYLFLSGDEMAYPVITKEEINKHLNLGAEADVKFDDVMKKVKERYEVYFIFPSHTGYWGDREVEKFWTGHLGERMLRLEDPEALCELIASTIAANEGVEMKEILESLEKNGTSKKAKEAVKKTLAAVK